MTIRTLDVPTGELWSGTPGETGTTAPTDSGTPPDAEADARPRSIAFSRSSREVEAEPDATVLETAESAGLELSYECRSGICGQCKVRLISGRVAMATQDALTADDRRRGLILACQARPQTSISIDA